ncbi:putative photosystem I PsaJ, reaction centre subunit IX [Helianthus anomalus]
MTGFEPVTFCTQNKRATKLRYIPSIGLQCHCREFLSCFPHRGFSMRDLKTYLSVAPVLSTLWFGALAGLLIEINRFFPDALTFPFF